MKIPSFDELMCFLYIIRLENFQLQSNQRVSAETYNEKTLQTLVHHNLGFCIFLMVVIVTMLRCQFSFQNILGKEGSCNGKRFCCQLFCRVNMILLRVNKVRVQTVGKDIIHFFRVIWVQFIQPLLALLGILICLLQQIQPTGIFSQIIISQLISLSLQTWKFFFFFEFC